MLCEWSLSPTCPANLSECWKQFSLPGRQSPHTCNMARDCLQAGQWSCHTPLTGLPGYLRPAGTYDLYPFPAATLPKLECQLVEQRQRIPQGGGGCKCIPRLLLSMRKRLIECINKSHTRYDLQYKFVIITCSGLYLFSAKPVNWGGLLLLAWVYMFATKMS